IRLKHVLNAFSLRIFLLELQNLLEPGNAKQRRLAALPCKADGLLWLPFDVSPDVGFEHILRHCPISRARIELFLLEIEAVSAVQIAEWPGRLCHYLEWSCHSRTLSQNGHLLRFLCCCCRWISS